MMMMTMKLKLFREEKKTVKVVNHEKMINLTYKHLCLHVYRIIIKLLLILDSMNIFQRHFIIIMTWILIGLDGKVGRQSNAADLHHQMILN